MDEEPGEECGPWVGDVGDPEEPRGCSQASMGDPWGAHVRDPTEEDWDAVARPQRMPSGARLTPPLESDCSLGEQGVIRKTGIFCLPKTL